MGVFINLIGKRFGHLLVVRCAGRDSTGKALWECLCDCGNTKVIASRSLLHNHNTRSCGCLKARTFGQPFTDLTGERFGCWTVLRLLLKDSNRQQWWECHCDCGTVRPVKDTGLREGRSTSCGCSWKKIMVESIKSSAKRRRVEKRKWLAEQKRTSK